MCCPGDGIATYVDENIRFDLGFQVVCHYLESGLCPSLVAS